MRRFPTLCSRTAFVILLVVVWLSSARAKAEFTLFDSDGWTVRTTGLVAAHYQLVMGDSDPLGNGKNLAGGRVGADTPSSDQRNNTITQSDIRSGFIGTQIGFAVARQISPTVHVDSFLAASVNGINSNRGQDTAAPKAADYREAWAQIAGPYGSLKFGRMFGLFGSSSAAVVAMAYQYGVGHPCAIDSATIGCGSVGAGPLYAGFDAAFRYTSPRFAGFQLQVAIVDPDTGASPVGKMSPYPRVDAELNFDQTFGSARLRLFGQSMWNRLESSTATTLTSHTVYAVMGTGLLDVGPVSAGGGAWTGAGIGERIPLEAADPGNPLAWDQQGNLRHFLGVYGNVQLHFAGTTITAGGGELFVKLTDVDLSTAPPQLTLMDQYEGHVTLNHKFADCIIANVEFMHWHSDWEADPTNPTMAAPKQSVNFMGAGMNYVW